MSGVEARALVSELALAATGSSADDRASGCRRLEGLDSRTWLLLDDSARSFSYGGSAPVTGRQPWSDVDLGEPTGFVAAVTSFHTDGHVRQRATRALSGQGGVLRSKAMAVRLVDHVRQVRQEARDALLPTLGLSDASAVLGVLLAGRRRQHAPSALAAVHDILLEHTSVTQLVETLVRDGDRAVRRWILSDAHDQQVLSPEQMLEVVRSDPDQRLRAIAAEKLVPVATDEQLRELLRMRSADARLTAVTYLPDEVLVDAELLALLLDRSARVREQARWRARRRGISPASYYRGRIRDSALAAHALMACLDGLDAVGSTEDSAVFFAHRGHASAAVRTAAVKALSVHAPSEQALDALQESLLDASPRVSSTAAQALVRLGAHPEQADAAWRSPQPWTRRAAWRMSHGSGSWDRVEADLRAAADADPQVAALGQAGIRNWLSTSAATTWATLSTEQHQRIQTLLEARPASDPTTQAVAFHARVQVQTPP